MRVVSWLFVGMLLAGCGTTGEVEVQAPLKPVPRLELSRYVGDWFLIASIPAGLDQGAHNYVVTHRLDSEGRVISEIRFRERSFTGKVAAVSLVSTIVDTQTNAQWRQALAPWGMGVFFTKELEYVVAYVADDYSKAVVGRSRRDAVWMFARTPELSESDYELLKHKIALMGYDVSDLQKTPQRWPDDEIKPESLLAR